MALFTTSNFIFCVLCIIQKAESSINPSLDATLTSATNCDEATFIRSKYVTHLDEYLILSQGEFIISSNCQYKLKLELSGNLVLLNLTTNDEIWSTNNSIQNIDNNTFIDFTLLSDHIYIW